MTSALPARALAGTQPNNYRLVVPRSTDEAGPAAPRRAAFLLRPAGAREDDTVRTFLGQLSPATSFSRFFAGLGNLPDASVRQLVEPAPRRGAWLATITAGTAASTAAEGAGDAVCAVVVHASWVQTQDHAQTSAAEVCAAETCWAEISVVVADRTQGLGVGNALVAAVLAEVRRTNTQTLRLDVLASHRRVIAMIARRWPGARPERDGTQLTFRLPLR